MGCSSSSDFSQAERPKNYKDNDPSLHGFDYELKGSSQTGTQSQESKFHKLSWEDFKGATKVQSKYWAESHWNVNWSYQAKIADGRALVRVQAKCTFDNKKSWVREEKKSQGLLEHEQGHYYIGCLCALTFMKRVSSKTFSAANYKEEVQTIFNETLKEYLKLEKLYDVETDHFRNKDQQKRWDNKIIGQIEELKAFWWSEIAAQADQQN